MANLDTLPAFLRSKGLKVVETPNWITRGYDGQDLTDVRGVLWHHTATASVRFSLTGAPTLDMCINGRSDLAGPLCNMVFGRDATVYMVATGVANHAGAGSAPGIPTDMGNHYLVGIEMESSGTAPWDWTPAQLQMAPRLGAAIEQWGMQHLPAGERLQLGHMEYSSQGKIDPAGWPGGMDGLRASINTVLAGSVSVVAQSGTVTPTTPTSTEDEDEMKTLTLIDDGSGKLWVTEDFVTKWHIPDAAWITHYLNIEKWGFIKLRRDSKGSHIMRLPAFGAEVPNPVKVV